MPTLARKTSAPCCASCAARDRRAQRTGDGSASLDVSASISSGLADIGGLDSGQIAAAVSGYTNLSGDATDAVLGVLDGGPVNADSLSPLIAMGLGALGVSPVGIAAVSVALPVLDAIESLFSSPQPKCSWTVGTACFTTPTRPYGPAAPDGTPNPDWITFDSLYASDASLLLQAFPWTLQVVCEVGVEGVADGQIPADPNERTIVEEFIYAFDVAWKANAEYWINGYQGLSDIHLLGIVRDAWDRAHADDSTYTFGATPPDPITMATLFGPLPLIWNPYAPAGGNSCPIPMGDLNQGARSLIGLIIAGVVTPPGGGVPTGQPPLTIHAGARIGSNAVLASLPADLAEELAGKITTHGTYSGSPNLAKGVVMGVATRDPAAVNALGTIQARAASGERAGVAAMNELSAAERLLLGETSFWTRYYALPLAQRSDPFKGMSTASMGKVHAAAGRVHPELVREWARRTRRLTR